MWDEDPHEEIDAKISSQLVTQVLPQYDNCENGNESVEKTQMNDSTTDLDTTQVDTPTASSTTPQPLHPLASLNSTENSDSDESEDLIGAAHIQEQGVSNSSNDNYKDGIKHTMSLPREAVILDGTSSLPFLCSFIAMRSI